jgi:pimeloyl-ACP methyl ester carboxylesterase
MMQNLKLRSFLCKMGFAQLVLVFSLCCNPAFAKTYSFFLVHGALLTHQSWHAVQESLSQAGYSSTAFNVPGRSEDSTDPAQITLTLAAKRACEAARSLPQDLIWVGHSQGGAIITQSLQFCPERIAALVYVAAVVPLPHESPFQELTQEEDWNFSQCATYDPIKKVFVFNPKGPIHEMFMSDLTKDQARKALSYFVSEPSEIGAGVLEYPLDSLLTKPKFYLETLQDKIIFPKTQKKYQAKTHFQKVYQLNASHSPFLSQPKVLGSILTSIADHELQAR